MRVFVQAASRGSLSAAGRTLGMSPAMATKHVDALEARLRVKLLHRTTRGLSLTDPGRQYPEGCHRILQYLDEVESDISAQRHLPSGTRWCTFSWDRVIRGRRYSTVPGT